MTGGYPPIEDHAIIGDCRTAALVDCEGTIDWLCLPRFDSPSVFGSLLDRGRGGCFQIRPAGAFSVHRRYEEGTAVLETTFEQERGEVILTDCMPVGPEHEIHGAPRPYHHLLRRLECTRGEMALEIDYRPRPGYGERHVPLEARERLGLWCQWDAGSLVLHTDVPLHVQEGDDRTATGTVLLREGEVRYFSLTYQKGEPALILPLGDWAEARLDGTRNWWRDWSARMHYDGPYRDMVLRSALTLKLLTYAPSGAVVAAVTTSLPEVLGGERNWDYRYCWLRDASWTVRALHELGFSEEAAAFHNWVLYATRLTAPKLRALYDIHGHSDLDERTLEHLEGYGGSRPVRVGNGAHSQLQLDVYGEVVAAAYEHARRGGRLDEAHLQFLTSVGHEICKIWSEPDEGIWEIRGPRRHHVYSKVMCWTALDRLVHMHDLGWIEDMPVEQFRDSMCAIRDEIETRGASGEPGHYMAVYDDDMVDSALLRMPATGYVQASDERFRRTFEHIVSALDRGHGLFARYTLDFDDLPGEEGAFDLCAFWVVECEALAGNVDAAQRRFEAILERANDVGLYAEETDPDSLRFLGNFPQGFAHIGLINAALTIEACRPGSSTAEPWDHEEAPTGDKARRGT